MVSSFSFLDYVWRGLVVGTLTSTLILAFMFLIFSFLKSRASQLQLKRFFNYQLLLLFVVVCASFLFVAVGDPELAAGCFDQFVKNGSSFMITRIVAGAWLTIAGLMIVRDLLRMILSVRKSFGFSRLMHPEIEASFEQTRAQLGLRNHIQLFTTEENVSPFVWGLFKYKVVIPTKALHALDPQALKNILAHELIHVRDRDALWLSFELLSRRLLFFNPLIFLVGEKHSLTIEKAADEEAVHKAGVNPSELLKNLVEVISLCKVNAKDPMALSASRSFRELKARMESLSTSAPKNFSNPVFNTALIISFIFSIGISVAQAKLAIADLSGRSESVGMMCTQIRHEKIIESWLQMEPVSNSCEK